MIFAFAKQCVTHVSGGPEIFIAHIDFSVDDKSRYDLPTPSALHPRLGCVYDKARIGDGCGQRIPKYPFPFFI